MDTKLKHILLFQKNPTWRPGRSAYGVRTASWKLSIVICPLLCCDYVTYVPALKFPKSWLRTLGYRPKIHHFIFSHKWGTRFKYLSKLCPYILMYSALHIMQWFSQVLDVFTPKIKRKIFDFYILWIKTNVAYTRLEMIARTKYCTTLTTTTASNWFVTLYYKLLPAVRSSSKHGRRWSSLLLYSISMCSNGLRRNCTPSRKWASFVRKLKIVNSLVEN